MNSRSQLGLYTEAVIIAKPQLNLIGAGAGTNPALHTIIDGPVGSSTGIAINNGVTGTLISGVRVQEFAAGGICGLLSNHATTIQNSHVYSNTTGANCQGGIALNGPVDSVTITGNEAVNNTTRGIVIWNGFKTNITITNNIVRKNNCCGIELQDGTASGVTISGNTVENNGDSGMAATGLMAGAGPNVISSNTVRNNGRFGIEIKLPNGTGAESGDGSIVVMSNTVELTAAIDPGIVRDLAGIAAFRRGWVATENNVDIPRGVVIKGNTVSGYQQPSDSDGFGIVVEGLLMTVKNNTLNNNDVGVQVQAGHLPYVANTPTDGDQSNLADQYFGRGNSPVACGQVLSPNTFSGNGTDTRSVGAGSGIVQNTNTGEYFCTIQAAIDDSDTVNGHTIVASAGTFSELVTVNKTVTLLGAQNGVDGRTRCDATSGESMMNGSQGAFNVQADDVVIDGFVIENSINTTYLGTGLYLPASFSGYQIRNNIFRNNIYGLFLNSSGVKASVVEKNCFKTNNVAGPASGNGIYSEFGLAKAAISDNYFTGHENTAILFTGYSAAGGARNVQITGNEFRQDNRIRLTYASDILISGNTNVDSVVHGVQIAGGSKNITITNNIMTGAVFAAVRVADSDGVGPNRNVVILNNKMNRNEYGLWVGAGALDGPLTARFNEMISNTVAVTTQTSLAGVNMVIERNNISLNTANGMQNSGGPTLDGRCNWWGAADGPGPVGPGSGNTVSTNVNFAPFLLTSDLNGPCVPSVKVVKVVVGDPPAAPWQFNGSGAMGTFTLPVAGGVKSFFDLGAGSFTISETPNPAYSSSVSCSNGATGGSSVSVTIAATESISCTFTNTRQMVNITIVKQSAPQSPTNFRFTGSYLGGGSGSDSGSSIPGFYLDDPASDDGDAYGSSKSFAVPAGAVYSFSEPAVSGWYLMSITCDPAASATVNLATRSVTVNTAAGQDVTCTFHNAQAGVLNVRKYREINGTMGQQAPETFLSAWTMQVKTTSTGTLVSQAATNALGKVSFSLKPGNYAVCEVMKSGWRHWANPTNLCFAVIVNAGGVSAQDFGNCLTASCPVSPSAVDGTTAPAAPALVLGADELEGWVEGWLVTPDGPVEQEGGELIEPDAGQWLFLPLITK